MRKRYMCADVIRALALLWVVVYHSWTTLGSPTIDNYILELLVKLGGEIGVTFFFILSGFGIYHSLESNMKRNGSICYKEYFFSRLKRICPNYYIALILMLTLTSAAIYLRLDGIKDILTHVFFIHNLFPSTHGSINGVLWTMGVIVQFYFIAPTLFKIIKKYPILTLTVSILLSIVIRVILFESILPRYNAVSIYYFIYSRQLMTAFDNFVIGMFVAMYSNMFNMQRKYLPIEIIPFMVMVMWCAYGDKMGIYTNNVSGYIWHSGLALLLGGILLLGIWANRMNMNPLKRVLLWLAKNEYGIYIWHYVVMTNMLSNSSILQYLLVNGYYWLILLVQVMVSVVVGCIISASVEALMVKIETNIVCRKENK